MSDNPFEDEEAALAALGEPDPGGASRDREQRRPSGAPPPRNDIITEDSAAVAFAEVYADRLRFCHDAGSWFEWDGAIWRPNRVGLAYQWARELARRLAADEDPKVRYVTSKTAFAAGVERFCRSDPVFAVTTEKWDRDAWLLGTPDGTVDLFSGKLRDANPADHITKATAVGPSLRADCPQWLAFLDQATGSDGELIRFIRQWCGYALTGLTKEHALVFVYGPGGNGKSVFLNVLTAILRDYATTAAMDTFTASIGDKHPTDMAMLRGARLVTASETEEGRAWAEAKIKQLTGGDPITARFMRQDFFTFTPSFKLTIVGNHQPVLKNVDEAARRRFNIVPFTRKPAKPDRDLETKLRDEWPGILRWMIEGCLDWQANGLVRPSSVIEATDAYFAEQDMHSQWLAEKCQVDPGKPDLTETASDLFASWTEYARAAGEAPGTLKSFGPAMRRKGLIPYRTKHARGYRGVHLIPEGDYARASRGDG